MSREAIVLNANIARYSYIVNGSKVTIETPTIQKAQFTGAIITDLTKEFLEEAITLNVPFTVSYIFSLGEALSSFTKFTITDPLLDASHGFTYGTPTITTTKLNSQIPTPNLYDFNETGSFTLSTSYFNPPITPSDMITISIPITATSMACNNFLGYSLQGIITPLTVSVPCIVENVPPIVYADLSLQNSCSLASDVKLFSGMTYDYTFSLTNLGNTQATIPAYALHVTLSEYLTFKGWKTHDLYPTSSNFEVFTDGQTYITNSHPLYIQPNHPVNVTYTVMINELGM